MTFAPSTRVRVLRGPDAGNTGAVLGETQDGFAVVRLDATDGAEGPVRIPVADLATDLGDA